LTEASENWKKFMVSRADNEGIFGNFNGKPAAIYDGKGDLIPVEAMNDFLDAMSSEYALAGALMPDAHKGYAMPIGGVIGSKEHICPAWVGYDIGCGVTSTATSFDHREVKDCSGAILLCMHEEIPTGFNHHEKPEQWDAWDRIPKTPFLKEVFGNNGLNQLGTMGGNNHFVEIGRNSVDNRVWVSVHSGSRNVGHKVATHYMRKASPDGKVREGHYFLSVKSENGENYLRDSRFCTRFAFINRLYIINKVIEIMQYFCTGEVDPSTQIDCFHNSVVFEHLYDMWVHRKGATAAREFSMIAIPANRADGIFIAQGKGSRASISSCSHGAGRQYSRIIAKQVLKVSDAAVDMKGIQAITHPKLIDEAPRAYKPISKVLQSQKSLVKIKEVILPIINFKDLRGLNIMDAIGDDDGMPFID
jgi:tRNA-splicing ligase RtcB (3'-phosphate/5'-hydroxy nucleic acid ligase)